MYLHAGEPLAPRPLGAAEPREGRERAGKRTSGIMAHMVDCDAETVIHAVLKQERPATPGDARRLPDSGVRRRPLPPPVEGCLQPCPTPNDSVGSRDAGGRGRRVRGHPRRQGQAKGAQAVAHERRTGDGVGEAEEPPAAASAVRSRGLDSSARTAEARSLSLATDMAPSNDRRPPFSRPWPRA